MGPRCRPAIASNGSARPLPARSTGHPPPLAPHSLPQESKMPVMKKWIALAAVAAAACGGSQPDAKTPPPSNVKDVQSNGEIPPENLRGAAGGGDYDKGVAALGNGDVDGANAIYDKMHERDPKDGTALVLLGLIDEKKGDKAGAEKAYK